MTGYPPVLNETAPACLCCIPGIWPPCGKPCDMYLDKLQQREGT